MQLARRFLMDFVLDNPVLRVDSPKKLLACLREYFILNPAEGSFNERGIPFWAIPYIPKSNHFWKENDHNAHALKGKQK